MATIEDKIDSDGIIRTILAGSVGDKSYYIYPRTDARSVLYEETTMEDKVKFILLLISNLQSLNSEIKSSIDSIANDTLHKETINNLLESIRTTVDNNSKNIIVLQNKINSLNFYTQEQMDQELYNISSDVSKYMESMRNLVNQISIYMNTNFDNSDIIKTKLLTITQSYIQLQNSINDDVRSWCNQTIVDINENMDDKMSNYYTREEVNNSISNISFTINNLDREFNTTKGELVEMNGKSEVNIINHIDKMQDRLRMESNSKSTDILSTIYSQIDSNNKQQTEQNGMIIKSNAEISDSINTMMSMLRSLGATSTLQYESADEEEY